MGAGTISRWWWEEVSFSWIDNFSVALNLFCGGKGFKSPFKNFQENIILHWLSEVPFVYE